MMPVAEFGDEHDTIGSVKVTMDVGVTIAPPAR